MVMRLLLSFRVFLRGGRPVPGTYRTKSGIPTKITEGMLEDEDLRRCLAGRRPYLWSVSWKAWAVDIVIDGVALVGCVLVACYVFL